MAHHDGGAALPDVFLLGEEGEGKSNDCKNGEEALHNNTFCLGSSKIANFYGFLPIFKKEKKKSMSVSRKVRERSLRLLLGETRNRCMACGKHVGDGEGCSISKIVPRNAERGWVALERRTVLCGECESMKNTFTIPDLANSFSFRARLGYLFRVMGSWLLGRISMVKMRALLFGFSLCQGLPSPNKVIENKREALLHETNFRCVYCGCALEKRDHDG